MAKKPKERDPEKALRVKQILEDIWDNERLRSPFFKALWTTTRHGGIVPRENKEKIREYCREE